MRFFKFLALIILCTCFTNCTLKERVVFNEDGSGNYLMSYDMAEVMKQMEAQFGEGKKSKDKKNEVMDTTVVFKDVMETYKDSVAALPEEKQMALEAVKDMYMKMTMDEEKGIFNFGIGLDFKSIAELQNIGDKIEKAKSLNAQNDQVSAMKGSPLGKFMGDGSYNCSYDYTSKGFARTTTLPEDWNPDELKIDENDESDKEFMSYFENAYYIVEYTFPKKIASSSFKNAQLSNNDKTITYKVSWIEFIKNPKLLDVNLTFTNE